MTGKERILRALRNRREEGITQVDFLGPTMDGEKPITRVAARIKDLRDDGHPIVVVGVRNQCAVYVLQVPVLVPPPAPADEPQLERLF